MIRTLAVSGFRSLRDVRLELGLLNIVTGANGSGKSSLYRALRLIADVAQGRIIASLAEHGGFRSERWAGPESFSRADKSARYPVEGTVRRNPVSLKLGFADDAQEISGSCYGAEKGQFSNATASSRRQELQKPRYASDRKL